MNSPASEVKALYGLAEEVLMKWLDDETPQDRRQRKAFELLADACQMLHAAKVNLSVGDGR